MPTTPDQLNSLFRADLDPLFRLVSVTVEGSEKLWRLNLEAGRSLFEQAAKASTAALSARGVEELIALQAGWLAPAGEQANAWSREWAEIVQATGAQWREVFEDGQSAVLQGGLASLFDAGLRALANAPERA